MSFLLYAQKNKLYRRDFEPVTSGSQNVYQVRFEFSGGWDGLTRTAVFKAGGEPVGVLLDDTNECTIPWEVLTTPGVRLEAGVCGVRDGTVVLPTIWVILAEKILPGAAPGESAKPPTPGLYEQLLDSVSRKGDRLDYDGWRLSLMSGDEELSGVEIAGGSGGGPSYGIGHGLKIRNGDLTVDTVDGFSGDNTLPMTAAGVQIVVGNIETLLTTI